MSLIDELIEEGIEKGVKVIKLWQQGVKPLLIANMLDLSLEQVKKLIHDFEAK
jgi:hypothetical protein